MATALTINSSPSSFQLRLGLQCRRGRTSSSSSSLIFSKTHLLSSSNAANHRRIVRLCAVSGGSLAAKEGEGKQRVSGGNSWRITAASGDAFAGWVDDETDSSNVSKQKQEDKKGGGGKGGIVAAAVAGVVLAAGLTFTSLYLSKKSSSAPKPDMEALTTQQEVLLSSDDLDDKDGQVGSEEITARTDEGFLHSDPESTTGINQDSSSSPDTTEDTFESGPMDNITGGTSLIEKDDSESSHTDATNITSSQEDMQVKPGFSNMSVLPNSDLHLPRIFEPEIVNGHTNASSLTDIEADPDAVMPESSTEPKDNLVAVSLDNAPVSDDSSTNLDPDIQKEIAISKEVNNSDIPSDLSSSSGGQIPNESLALDNSVISESGAVPSLNVESEAVMEGEIPLSNKDDHDLSKMVQVPREVISSPLEGYNLNKNAMSETTLTSVYSDSNINKPYTNTEIDGRNSYFEPLVPDSVSSAGIPAPSLVSVALQVPPGKVVVPAVVDQVQGHALAALQVLKVIEADVQPSDLCTRREYARWLVAASSALTRNSVSKVYPAMYIENVTELAFDDITTEDPDFASIQGLAEAGLISSKLSRNDMLQSSEKEQEPFLFFPESAVSRQDLVSWKMALEKRQLPEVDKKIVYQCCGFIDIDRINPDAWPALVADQSAGEQGIMALAFGYTRLFQPYKPVTKGQAAIALSTGEAAEIVSEELARIEAESMAETAVEAHTALVAQVEKDINASFEKELTMEREKIDAVEKMAQEAREELERLRAEREEENSSLMRGRAAVESEMQVLTSLRREVEEQLQSLMSDKMEISFERERINKLRGEAESENQAITRLQYELEVERKALAMARSWAEDEAKRAREQAKALEEARDRWEKHGIKVVVDDDLREDANAGVTWLSVGKESTVDATVSRAETLVSKLKTLAGEITGKSRLVIERIILKITSLISSLKEWAANSARKAGELQGAAVSKASASVQELQNSATELSSSLKEGAKRVAEDCRDGVGKISQKFKA